MIADDEYTTGFRERTDYIYQIEKQLNLVREELSRWSQRLDVKGAIESLRVLIVMIQTEKILSQAHTNEKDFAKKMAEIENEYNSKEKAFDKSLAQLKLCIDTLDKANLLGLMKTATFRMK